MKYQQRNEVWNDVFFQEWLEKWLIGTFGAILWACSLLSYLAFSARNWTAMLS
jgi:LPS O-antigen subunit length determinant protein (WzzB/FepE family)